MKLTRILSALLNLRVERGHGLTVVHAGPVVAETASRHIAIEVFGHVLDVSAGEVLAPGMGFVGRRPARWALAQHARFCEQLGGLTIRACTKTDVETARMGDQSIWEPRKPAAPWSATTPWVSFLQSHLPQAVAMSDIERTQGFQAMWEAHVSGGYAKTQAEVNRIAKLWGVRPPKLTLKFGPRGIVGALS